MTQNNINKPLVTIIMAAYNAEKTITKSIESVLEQTYENFELLVINDCSQDSTKEIVELFQQRDKRVKLIDNTINSGVSYTRHVGLLQANGEYISILDSDDSWNKDKLQKQIDLIMLKNAKLVFTGVSFIDENNVKKAWIMHVPETIVYRKLLYQNMITNSSAIVEKSLYEQYESMGDQMHEDYACWLKILRSGVIAFGIDEPLIEYRVSSQSKSGNKIKSGLMIWRTYRYIGLGWMISLYYLFCYMINGSLKHLKIKNS